jgi:hypothetical protein
LELIILEKLKTGEEENVVQVHAIGRRKPSFPCKLKKKG